MSGSIDNSEAEMQCQSCLQLLSSEDTRVSINEQLHTIFSRFLNFPLEDGVICVRCNVNLLSFDAFQRRITVIHTAKNAQKAEESDSVALEKADEDVAKEDPAGAKLTVSKKGKVDTGSACRNLTQH